MGLEYLVVLSIMMTVTINDNPSGKTAKRKRVNRNKKKNWRKHVDITDIDEALEGERLELRTGGIISKKEDHEIFFLDKTAGQDNKTKAKRWQNKRLKVDEIITPRPDLVKSATAASKRTLRRQKRATEKKEVNLSKGLKRKKSTAKVPTFDLWASDAKDLYDKEIKKKDVHKYTESVSGHVSYTRPKHLQSKPCEKVEQYKYKNTPAVEVAQAGASYNPTYEDHQNLLLQAHMVELAKEKAQQKIERALHVPYEELPDIGTRSQEMAEGLFDGEKQESEEELEEENAETVQNPPVRAIDRKTTRTRKRELREKLEKQQKEEDRCKKLRENEVFRTKTYLAEIKARDRRNAERRELRKKKTRLVTLSNVKFVEQDIEVKLSDELKGSLRELKPEAGLLTDRYKSFQKRMIVEPRCKQNKPKSKKKTKFQEKRSFREFQG